jgi:hypothetical protein
MAEVRHDARIESPGTGPLHPALKDGSQGKSLSMTPTASCFRLAGHGGGASFA